MATEICQQQLSLIVTAFTAIAIMTTYCKGIAVIPGEARPDDPHACYWFARHTEASVYRCCDGYFKTDEFNLTGNCIECPKGTFGFSCKNNCTCKNGDDCDKRDGSCHCSTQYFGNSCQYFCNCQNGATCMSDGSCSCADGFHGDICEKECSCPENSECDSKQGECICQDGFYGSSCLPCNCSNTEQCDPFTGLCSCKPGYYGENCDKHCSCFNGGYCGDKYSDQCKCSSGWNGGECTDCNTGVVQSNCEEKCLHCFNGDRCSVENGDCLCSPGWQGNRCDQKCDEGFYGKPCSEKCSCEHGSCDHATGICTCEEGWTGQHCNHSCPDSCVLCNADICSSCKAGWTGERCSDKCEPGFHGGRCKERCPQCNCTSSCDHTNGKCADVVRCEEQECKYKNVKICVEHPFRQECEDGYVGYLCNAETVMTVTKGSMEINVTTISRNDNSVIRTSSLDTNSSSQSLIIGIIIPFAIIITVTLVIVAIFIRKSNRRDKTPEVTHEDDGVKYVAQRNSSNGSGIASISDESQRDVYATVDIVKRKSEESDFAVNNRYQHTSSYEVNGKERHIGEVQVDYREPQENLTLLDHNDQILNHETEGKTRIPEGLYAVGPVRDHNPESDAGTCCSTYDHLDGLRYQKRHKQRRPANENYEELTRVVCQNDPHYDRLEFSYRLDDDHKMTGNLTQNQK